MNDPRPLRVGLLLDELTQPTWVASIIRGIAASTSARVALVVLNSPGAEPETSARRSRPARWWANRRMLLLAAYQRFDAARFRVENDPFATTDIGPLVEGVPVLHVTPRRTKHLDYFSDEAIAAIRAHDLDVVLRLGFRILKGGALSVARHGVWSYHHGDNLVNRGGPAGFWEVALGHPVTGSILQVLTEDLDDGQVIYRSWAGTNQFSVAKNRAHYYTHSTPFVQRMLDQLHGEGATALRDPLPHAGDWRAYSERLYVKPTTWETARFLVKLAGRFIHEKWRRVMGREQWLVAIHAGRERDDQVPERTLYRYKPLVPPMDRIWADPFPIRHDGHSYVFIEEMVYATKRGHIALVEVDEKGKASVPRPVLQQPHHLSYPFLFRWRNEFWMIPESAEARRVDLFRATRFPDEWTLERTLLDDVNAVDATLLEHDGRWWMFYAAAERGTAPWDELYIQYADSPLGPFRPHRLAPAKSDVRSSRPAGRIFTIDGRLYRPSQDCSRRYGYAMTINRIERLTPDEFVETDVSRIEPRWMKNLVATHTLNADRGLSAIDGRVWHPRWW